MITLSRNGGSDGLPALREAPRIAHDLGDVGVLRTPAQLSRGGLAGGDEHGRITAPARCNDGRDRVTGHGAAGFDHLTHGEARTAAEVVDVVASRLGVLE